MKATAVVYRLRELGLSYLQTHVALALLEHDRSKPWPTNQELADAVGCWRPHAAAAVRALVERGLVRVVDGRPGVATRALDVGALELAVGWRRGLKNNSPYVVEGPAIVSFSGGRTSAYLLRQVLDHGLREDVVVCFANTGRELPETLDFVHEVERRWSVKIHWLEYRRTTLPLYKSIDRQAAAARARAAAGVVYGAPGSAGDAVDEPGFVEVTYETASRRGEPFENLIDLMGLPNPTTRLCTSELKVRVIKKFMMSLGHDGWANIVGIRADEPLRVARMRAPTGQRWENELPLADAGVVKADVLAFWARQRFDLQLPVDEDGETYLGNCDLCFLKSTARRQRVARERPELVGWWVRQEERTGQRFRDHSARYETLLQLPVVVEAGDGLNDCACHD